MCNCNLEELITTLYAPFLGEISRYLKDILDVLTRNKKSLSYSEKLLIGLLHKPSPI